MSKVVYYRDESEDRLWRYRVIAQNGEIVHASHKGWSVIADAYSNLYAVFGLIDHGETIYEAEDGWRWRLPAPIAVATDEVFDNTYLVSKSHEAFETRDGCEHNVEVLAMILENDAYESVVEDE